MGTRQERFGLKQSGKTRTQFEEMCGEAVRRGWCSEQHARAVLRDFHKALGVQETTTDDTN